MASSKFASDREQALALLAGRAAPGRLFFETASHALALGAGCRWAGIGLLVDGTEAVDLLAFWDGDQARSPFTFPLANSPCAEVYRQASRDPHFFFGTAVADRFPEFLFLQKLGARSYRGEGFRDSDGRLVGHVFVLGETDQDDRPSARAFVRLVAQRVGAEYNRMRAEDALARSEARHAALFHQSNDGILLLDTRGQILDVNQVTCGRLGRSRDELIGSDVISLMGGGSIPFARTALENIVSGGGENRSAEMEVQREDGSTYPVEVTSTIIATQGEQLVQVIVRDLTDRKRAEEALRLYQQMVASVGDQMVFIDRAYVFRAMNEAYLQSPRIRERFGPGVQVDDLVGQTVGEVIGEARFDTLVRRHLDRALDGDEISFETEVEGADPPYFLDVRYHPYRRDGSVVGVVGVLRDISRRKRDQAAILRIATDDAIAAGDLPAVCRLVTETAAETVKVARVSVWMFEDDGRSVRCLDRFSRRTGRHDSGFLLPLDDFPDHLRALSTGRAVDASDARADPRTRELTNSFLEPYDIGGLLDAPIRVRGVVVGLVSCESVGAPRNWRAADLSLAGEVADQVALVLMNRDRKRLEETLFRNRKLESLGKLTGGVAHDFNNLLTRVLGCTELALYEPDIPPSVSGHLDRIRDAALKASDLCTKMLAYAGHQRLSLEQLALPEIVERVGTSLATDRVAVDIAIAPDLALVEGDARQFDQMLASIVTNAIESYDDRTEDARVCVTLDTVSGADPLFDQVLEGHMDRGPRADAYLRLVVQDQGVGMDATTLASVFDPFFTTKFIGRGLGLAAALGSVKAHRGGIVLTSKPDAGTRVDVLLPALEQCAASPSSSLSQSPSSMNSSSVLRTAKGTVLVVDDEPTVRDVALKLLAAIGYEAIGVGDGIEAVRRFEATPNEIDAVMLDLTMPGMAGDQVGVAMRRVRPDLPIVITSGYSEHDASERLGDLRFDSYLRKPYELRQLVEVLAEVMPK